MESADLHYFPSTNKLVSVLYMLFTKFIGILIDLSKALFLTWNHIRFPRRVQWLWLSW